MGTTTSTTPATRTARPRSVKKAKRTLGIVPFRVHGEERPHQREVENAFVYGVQELIGFLGKSRTVDVAPCYAQEELTRKRDSRSLPDTKDLMRSVGAAAILTGESEVVDGENGRVDGIELHVELRVPDGRKLDIVEFDLSIRNVAPREEPTRFLVDVHELLEAQRTVFLAVKRRLTWRYSAGPARRKYYEYRQQHPLTRSFEAYRSFVRARRMCTRREEKLELYLEALRHDPCLGHAYRNVGYLHKEGKDLDTAIRYYRQAVRCLIDDETLADAWAELGLCYANSDRIEEAIRCWHTSRRWNDRNKDVYANLAIGYEEKGCIDKAIRYFERAQRIDPEYYWACRGLGRIYAGRQDWPAAIQQLSIQLKIAPEDAWGHYTLGNCYFQEGDPSKARSHCRKAVELDPHGDAGRRAFQLLMEMEA